MNPKIIQSLLNYAEFREFPQIFASPCPVESCTIFFYQQLSLDQCYVIRQTKGEKIYWVTTVQAKKGSGDRHYLEYMHNCFESYYEKIGGEPRRPIVSRMDLLLNSKIATDRVSADRGLNGTTYLISDRSSQYQHASALALNAKESIKAIDATSVFDWEADPIMQHYLEANKESKAIIKQRVHIFRTNLTPNVTGDQKNALTSAYKKYIEKMNNAGIHDLRFLSRDIAEEVLGSSKIGTVIFDDSIAFTAQNDVGKEDNVFRGTVSLVDVISMNKDFEDIWKNEKTLNLDEFRKNMGKVLFE